MAQFPRNVAPEGVFPAIDDKLIGRVVIARMAPREPVTESRLAPVGAAGGLSSSSLKDFGVTFKVAT